MKIIISEQQYNRLFEQEEKAFSKAEVALFKNLNKNKEKLTTLNAYKDYLKRAMRVFGMDNDNSDVLAMIHKYSLNYREDGMYELTTAREVHKPISDKGLQSSTHADADALTKARIPFKGGTTYTDPNKPSAPPIRTLKANWEVDGNGEKQYVVLSFEWYPIFIYKNYHWYEVSESYSSRTAVQIRKCRPSYDTISLSPSEMKKLRAGDEVFDAKFEAIFDKCRGIVGQEFKERRKNGNNTRYKITGMKREEDKIVVMVDLLESDTSFRNYGDAKSMLTYLINDRIKAIVGKEIALGDLIDVEVKIATQQQEIPIADENAGSM